MINKLIKALNKIQGELLSFSLLNVTYYKLRCLWSKEDYVRTPL